MTYFMLEQRPSGSGTIYRPVDEWPRVEGIDSWMTGERFSVAIPQPLEFRLDLDTPGQMFVFDNVQVPLMREDMVEALNEIGVANLDVYPARIHDPIGGTDYENYFAVNIVGVISAANLDESDFNREISERLISMQFDRLVLDEKRINCALLFRLAECVSGIVVHEKVRDHLLARGFRQLGFVDPANWSG